MANWKVTLDSTDLRAGLEIVKPALPTKSTMPILSCVLLRYADDTGLRLSATDMEYSITTTVPASGEEPQDLAVMARNFIDFAGTLSKAEEISLGLVEKGNRLSLNAGAIKGRFSIAPDEEFPLIAEFDPENEIGVDGPALIAALDKLLFAASSDESHPVLTGIYMAFAEGQVRVAAADGFRLSRTHLAGGNGQEPIQLIIPATPLAYVRKLDPEKLQVALTASHNGVIFTDVTTTVTSQLIDGNYPDTERIVPGSHVTRIVADRKTLESAVKRALIFTGDAKIVVLDIQSPDSVTVGSGDTESGEGSTNIPVEMVGTSLEIAFNGIFLREALRHATTQDVALEFNKDTTPCVLREVGGDENYVHVLMPMHLGRR